VFAGTQVYAREHTNWECVVQPFIGTLRKGRGAKRYDGIIARATPELVRNAAKARIPLVNIWSAAAAGKTPSVLSDFAACGRMAAEHLLQRGFRQFAFHGFSRHPASMMTWTGFVSVLRKAKCTSTKLSVPSHCDESARSWNKYTITLERWIARWRMPVGVLVTQDILGRYLTNACLNAGLRIPDDVALIGLGNEPLICLHPEPSLSSFDLNSERVGYEAAALLDRMMNGKAVPSVPNFIEPAELIVRRSTDAYVVDDPMVVAALRYIGEHCYTDLRVDDVANHVHATVRSLERHFRAALGRTMSEEVTRLRLERAKRLLVESDILVKNVAHQCGFRDVKHFHKMFSAAERTSPGEFRKGK
jgi:LacI family transcriptional regulator